MKLMKRKTRLRLTDSKLKNILLFSVTTLTPNIDKLVKCLKSHELKFICCFSRYSICIWLYKLVNHLWCELMLLQQGMSGGMTYFYSRFEKLAHGVQKVGHTWSNGWSPRSGEVGQGGLKVLHLRCHSQKTCVPQPKKFFCCRLEDLLCLLSLWTALYHFWRPSYAHAKQRAIRLFCHKNPQKWPDAKVLNIRQQTNWSS